MQSKVIPLNTEKTEEKFNGQQNVSPNRISHNLSKRYLSKSSYSMKQFLI